MTRDELQGWCLVEAGALPQGQIAELYQLPGRGPELDLCGQLLSLGHISAVQAETARLQAQARSERPPSGIYPSPARSISGVRPANPKPARVLPATQTARAASSHPRSTAVGPLSGQVITESARGPESLLESRRPALQFDEVNRRVGAYEITGELGRGGMGVVYAARHEKTGREVALKMLLLRGDDDRRAIERFEIEARAVARLRHTNVIRVSDIATGDALAYMAMEKITGGSLGERLKRQGKLALDVGLGIALGVARGLQHAHERAIVHRDLKPDNILLKSDGEPVVTDFGLAKALDQQSRGLSKTGEFMGTLAYMPPEQASGDHARIDGRADVYALGATLFEMLTGRPPFQGDSQAELMAQVLFQEAPSISDFVPDAPEDLCVILERCLAKEPDWRYRSAGALAEDLERLLEGEPIEARGFNRLERVQIWRERNPLLAKLALASVLVFSLSGAAVVAWSIRRSVREQLDRQRQETAAASREAKARAKGEQQARAALKKAEESRQLSQRSLAAAEQARGEAERAQAESERSRRQAERSRSSAVEAQRRAETTIAEGFLEKAETEFNNLRLGHAAAFAAQALSHPFRKGDRTGQRLRKRSQDLIRIAVSRAGWEWTTPTSLPEPSFTIASSYRRSRLAAGAGRDILLWNLKTGRHELRLSGHEEIVQSLDFSPDGRRLASASWDRTVRLWNPLRGTLDQTLLGHTDKVMAVEFSPDGQRLASGGLDRSVRIWDFEKGKTSITIRGLSGRVSSLSYFPDNERLAVGLLNRQVIILSTKTGAQLKTLRGHTQVVTALRVAPDGSYIASASKDGELRLWEVATGLCRKAVKAHAGVIYDLDLSPDGAQLVTASEDGRVGLWSSADGRKLRDLRADPSIPAYAVRFVGSTESPQIAVSAADRSLRLMDLKGQTSSLVSGQISTSTAIALSPGSGCIYNPDERGTIRSWDLKTGKARGALSLGGAVTTISSRHPGRLWVGHGDGRITALNSGKLGKLAEHVAHPKQAIRAVIELDGRRLLSATNGGELAVWRIPGLLSPASAAAKPPAKLIARLSRPKAPISCLALSPDGKEFAVGELSGRVSRWSCVSETPKLIGELGKLRGGARGLSYHPRNPKLLFCVSGAGGLTLLRSSDGKQIFRVEAHRSAATCLAISPDGDSVVTGAEDGSIMLWDVVTGQRLRRLWGVSLAVRQLAFTKGAVYAASDDRTVRRWRIAGGRLLKRRRIGFWAKRGALTPQGSGFVGVAESPKGVMSTSGQALALGSLGSVSAVAVWGELSPRVATGHADGLVVLWDPSTGKEIRRFAGHSKAITRLVFFRSGSLLASASIDRSARIWDCASGYEACTLKGHRSGVTAIAASKDGLFATGTAAGVIVLWNASTGLELRRIQAHRLQVNDLIFEPTTGPNRRLISASKDRVIGLWRVSDGRTAGLLRGHEGPVTRLAIRQESGLLASISLDRSLRLWSLQALRERRRHELSSGSAVGLCFLPEGPSQPPRVAALTRGGELLTWDASVSKLIPIKTLESAPRLLIQSLSGLRVQGFKAQPDDGCHFHKP